MWQSARNVTKETLFHEIETQNMYLNNFISFAPTHALVSLARQSIPLINKPNLKHLHSNSSFSLTYSKGLGEGGFRYIFVTVCKNLGVQVRSSMSIFSLNRKVMGLLILERDF